MTAHTKIPEKHEVGDPVLPPQALVSVTEEDTIIGPADWDQCHLGGGRLHRGVSVFIVDAASRVLLQRRSAVKPLWPLHWSNSCCTHPCWGESSLAAASRRTVEELGVEVVLREMLAFSYAAAYEDRGCEREICRVYLGRVETPRVLQPNPEEVAELQWLPAEELDARAASEPAELTPWSLLAWRLLRAESSERALRQPQGGAR